MLFSSLTRNNKNPELQKVMIINVINPEESRVAIIEKDVLQQLSVETTSKEVIRGNIYKGIVQKVQQSLHAAFVEYGGTRPGFLPLHDVRPDYYNQKVADYHEKLPAEKILKKNQEIIVQVTKEGKGGKGAALTTYVSLPGRYLVLMPGYQRTGVSRKIEDETERQKLKDIGRQLKLPQSMGFIIRTAGMHKTHKELQRDADYLMRLWKAIEGRSRETPAPSLIYQESNVVIQSIRDYFTSDITEVVVDDPEIYRKVREFFKQIIPKHQRTVKLYEEAMPVFLKYRVEAQIQSLYERAVPLKSGGRIAIDSTEALVSIDVNTGSFTRGKDPEETALLTNLEAAEEIARQLRLRDLGGLIAIDFIDMKDPKNRQQVERHLRNAFRIDKANIELGPISKFGILEMSREYLRSPLLDASHGECACCGGTGKVRGTETLALSVLCDMYDKASGGNLAEIRVSLSREAAEYLLNYKRKELCNIEQQFRTRIIISGEAITPADGFRMETVQKSA